MHSQPKDFTQAIDNDMYSVHRKSAAIKSDYTQLVASGGLDGLVKLMEHVKGGETECN